MKGGHKDQTPCRMAWRLEFFNDEYCKHDPEKEDHDPEKSWSNEANDFERT